MRPSSSSTSSEEVFTLAQHWIVECERDHPSCRRPSDTFYPTRLLEIIPPSDIFDFRSPVRLVSKDPSEQIENQPEFEGTYATLSHCWGGMAFCKLELGTLTRFQHAIPFDDLPLSFQHAVIFARRLKIRWIWIDALCIIQDSESDWLRESATMKDIYAHSYCNISATAAHDSTEGLFRDRDPDRNWAPTVAVRVKGIADIGTNTITCTILDLSFWETSVEQAPVNKRSWVLQERLLAPRVLHWCRDQIAFECRHVDRAECRPAGVPHLLMMHGQLVEGARFKRIEWTAGSELQKLQLVGKNPSAPQERLSSMVLGTKPRWHYYEIWKRVVETYTKMELTDPKDRLIALSGIAKMIKERMQTEGIEDEYIAGLWQRGLTSQLLWYVNEADGHEPQPFDNNRPKSRDGSELLYRAPTFSWASVETSRGITFAEITKVGLRISLEVVRLKYLTDDNFGILTGGYIVLKGNLRRILLIDNLADPKFEARQQRAILTNQTFSASTASAPAPQGCIFRIFRILLVWLVGTILALWPSSTRKGKVQSDTRNINRWSWSLMKDGKPLARNYSVVYLDSPASQPSVFGPDAKVFVVPALLTEENLVCLMVQATDGDYGIRYKRVGLTMIFAGEKEVQDILTPPTRKETSEGRYYWGPDGREPGRSIICII